MNEVKRKLIIATIIFDFISMAAVIAGLLVIIFVDKYVPTEYATFEEFWTFHILEIVLFSLDIALYSSAAICLSVAIKNKGASFSKNRKVFLAGFILNIISGPLSIATILLYIAQFNFIDSQVAVDNSVEVKKSKDEEMKEKVEKLRKLKDDGLISEEEFNEQIMRLL